MSELILPSEARKPKLKRKVVRPKMALVDQSGYYFCMHLIVKKKLC